MSGHARRLTALAWPVYGELLSGVIASVVSTLWVARLGGPAVAAVTLAGTVENLLLGLVLVVGSGTSLLLSRALGTGDRAAVGRIARTAWWLCGVGTLLLAVPGFLLREQLAALFLTGPAVALATGYFAIAFPGLAAFTGQRVADELFKGAGDTRTPMRMALLGNGLLLALDPLLIYGAGPFPALGVTGAALALVASRAVALAVTLRLRRGSQLRSVRREMARTARQLVAAGAPFGVDFTARMAVGTVQLWLVAGFGVSAVAGYGIGYRALMVVTMAFYAVRQAATIEAARFIGAGRFAELPALARDVRRLAAVIGASAAALCVALAGPISRLFTDDPSVVVESVGFLRMMGCYLLPYALVVAVSGVHQAAGRGRRLVAATTTGLAVQLVSAIALARLLGVDGVWAAMALGAITQLVLLGSLTGPQLRYDWRHWGTERGRKGGKHVVAAIGGPCQAEPRERSQRDHRAL